MTGKSIALIHGYFLGDSGSTIYVRELARELKRCGHDVTLVCQEPGALGFGFIDSLYQLDDSNTGMTLVFEREPGPAGTCRLVRPALGGRLLTYVAGPFPGYEAKTFQDASESEIAEYIRRNLVALETVFARWHPDFVQANHLVMQPYIARKTLPPGTSYVVTIHGSALNFTARTDPRMAPYAIEGLEGALAVGALSETSREEVIAYASDEGLDIADKTLCLPPGVDTGLMRPIDAPKRKEVLARVAPSVDPARDSVAVFAGRLLWTKGLQYAVAALPLVLQRDIGLHIVVVGDGPMAGPLARFIDLLDTGELDAARDLTRQDPELRPGDGFGPVLPDMDDGDEAAYIAAAKGNLRRRIHFTGHLSHEDLAPIYAASDFSLALSVFPEAFALVSIEALASGALPVVTYQTGLRAAADIAIRELDDHDLRRLEPGVELTRTLAEVIPTLLERYPTRTPEFRARLHSLADANYAWSRVAQRYLELYETTVEQRRDG